MPSQPTLTRGALTEAAILRQQADDLLHRLIVDRQSSEQRFAAAGRRDPLKAVTGSTALERAIASAREMIAEMDLLLVELDSGIQAVQSPQAEPKPTSLLRSSTSATSLSPMPAIRARVGGMLLAQRPVAAPA